MADEGRQTLRLVVTGHVDHGKSTVIGRLLHDTGSLPEGAVERIRRVSAETGQPFELAFLLDAFEEERRQGITIDTTQLQFRTARRDYVIIDAPGHKQFLKNMISGASGAEAAFLVVDARRGVEEQSRRHAHMLALLGIGQVGLLVNKMDLVGYDRAAFEAISGEMGLFLGSLGLRAGASVPLSALEGENVLRPSPRMPWHQGPSLVAALDGLEKDREEEGLRLPLQDVYKFDDRRILAGRVEAGGVKAGDRVLISPGGKETRVASLAAWLPGDQRDRAGTGESVGLVVEDEFFNRRGEVVSGPGDPPAVADRLKASIFWMGRRPLETGRRYRLRLATSEAEATVTEIGGLMDSSSLAPIPARGRVGPDEVAEVEIALDRKIALDPFSRHKATGRFVLVDGFDVAGGGIVTAALGEAAEGRGFAHGRLRARCEVFEEYYYSLGDLSVRKAGDGRRPFTVGDPVPLRGQSYGFPESFDIAVFRDLVAVLIRGGQVAALVPLADYVYGGLPVVNGRGFGILVNSPEEWARASADLSAMTPENEARLARRWLDFNAFRHIPIGLADFDI
ncbi:MAG: sulfate adenylyltransferase [Deltaproteobacteria bacterium]|jgi:sulfate adenylyltransferase large subunit|nr:sulfate adenylyltransferase [Deltaproteobacteria bacterium]